MSPTAAVTPNRNMDLQQLVTLLRDQSTRAVDVIAGSGAVRAADGMLVLDGTQPQPARCPVRPAGRRADVSPERSAAPP